MGENLCDYSIVIASSNFSMLLVEALGFLLLIGPPSPLPSSSEPLEFLPVAVVAYVASSLVAAGN